MEHALSAAELLNVWEQARSLSLADGALSLLALADSKTPREKLAQLSIGRRDAELLKLREKIFGSHMTGRTNCPACGQPMEMNFTVADVQAAPPPKAVEQFAANFDEHEIRFRLPNSSDLATLVPGEDVAAQKQRLIQRCVLSATRGGQSLEVDQLPDSAVSALSERMSELDPQGDVQLALSCPQCNHRWHAPLDVASFVWNEAHAWAVRMLRDVHVLASAYGWREVDILAMSPWRRQAYIELIEQ
jgi:uncharacterized protein (UPF0212 family)